MLLSIQCMFQQTLLNSKLQGTWVSFIEIRMNWSHGTWKLLSPPLDSLASQWMQSKSSNSTVSRYHSFTLRLSFIQLLLQKLYDHNFVRISHLPSVHSKGQSVPLQVWRGPEGSRKLRVPDFMTTAQDGGKVVSLTHRPPLPTRKFSWYSFLLEAESIPGPQCDRKDYVNEKFQWHQLGSNQRTLNL